MTFCYLTPQDAYEYDESAIPDAPNQKRGGQRLVGAELGTHQRIPFVVAWSSAYDGSHFSECTGETAHPTAGETGHPTTGKTLHPTTGETARPTTGEMAHPTTGEMAHPTIQVRQPISTTGDSPRFFRYDSPPYYR